MLTMEKDTETQTSTGHKKEIDIINIVKQMGLSVENLESFLNKSE